MKIIIHNMVSNRCKILVKSELDKLDISYTSIELGEVNLSKAITENQLIKLKNVLQHSGLELIQDGTTELIEKIVNIVIETVHYSKEIPHINFSILLSEKLNKNYHYLAEVFSKNKGVTLEHFIILHKIEKIKELIMYDQLNLTQISYQLNYSSVSHLSKQFKKITGCTPTFFKNLPTRIRRNLEDL
ncbi:helix-turn-helix domain-containing protein [Sphingobacterium bovisgrunnientis]|uniref:helix-turn-helix domain-containing protein n=1 Tax=Sphingobacterium bovisgrunnientis TaxID=1874697 RepID=UPI00135CD9B4|nr:AraC family transcriptional regulator [Sphingobacterium bovisgrunnientis]